MRFELKIKNIKPCLKHFRAWLYMGILMFLTVGCKGPIFESYQDVDKSNWTRKDSFSFEVPVKEPGKYALNISLRTTNDYQFANLWLNINMQEPSGESNKQRFNIPLYSPEGYPLQQDLGAVHIRKFPGARLEQRILPVDITTAGNYTFTLTQAMRVDELHGIEKVGLQLKKIP